MMSMSEVLGKIISVVFCTGSPVDVDVYLEVVITSPIVLHIAHSIFLLFNIIICDARGALVVCLKRCQWLRMAEVVKDVAD